MVKSRRSIIFLFLILGLLLTAACAGEERLPEEARPAAVLGTPGILYYEGAEYRVRCDWWTYDYICREVRLIETGGLVTPGRALIVWNPT